MTRKQELLAALERGERIREIRSNTPVTYRPRSERDTHPWVVYESGLRQEFRLTSKEVMIEQPRRDK